MSAGPAVDPEQLCEGRAVANEACRAVRSVIDGIGSAGLRTTRTQVAFRRRRGFADLWMPVEWARRPGVHVVLSVALAREDPSPRWKQVARPSAGIWMHHLEGS